MSETRSFEQDCRCDKFDLDGEAERQSSNYLYWSRKAATARGDRDSARMRYEVRRAELATDFRISPPAGLKVTNDTVCEFLDANKELRDLRKEWIEADRDYDELNGACKALEMKKSSIDNLIKLHLNNYFSDPSRPGKAEAIGDSFRGGLGRGRG